MEIRRACQSCRERWDGGLHDKVCPSCKAITSVVVSTDESHDNFDKENSNDNSD